MRKINDEWDSEEKCIGVCELDDNKVCIGCHRTIDEIKRSWNDRNIPKV